MPQSTSLAKIKQQIAALEKKAQEIQKAENLKVIDRIKAMISKHGLSASDLGFADAGGPKSVSQSQRYVKRRSAGKATSGVPMYRDPESGKTWTGRGKPPGWIAGATDRSSFLIDATPSANTAVGSVKKKAKSTKSKRSSSAGKGTKRSQATPAVKKKTSGGRLGKAVVPASTETVPRSNATTKPKVRAKPKAAASLKTVAERAAAPSADADISGVSQAT